MHFGHQFDILFFVAIQRVFILEKYPIVVYSSAAAVCTDVVHLLVGF